MRIDYDNIGNIGVIKDQDDYNLPQGAWSDSRNMRFQNGVAIKFKGWEDAFSATTSISISPVFSIAVSTETDVFWAYGKNRIYGTDGVTHTDISDTTLSTTTTWGISGSIFGGNVIINNGVNCPRTWGDSSAGPSLGKNLQILEAWSSTASNTCRFIRPFKNYLIAGDITDAGNRNPRLLQWSHPALPGQLPNSWDYGDATKDAGRYELAQTNDFLIDGLQLRDSFIVYKEHSTWGMQFIGAPNIFRFYQLFPDIGMISQNCAAVFHGDSHAVFGHNDIYVHNGQNLNSIMESRLKDWIYTTIDSDNFNLSFVVSNYPQEEVWFCFPQSGSTYPDLAAVWNYQYNTTQIVELSNFAHIFSGIIPTTQTTWDGDSETWDSDASVWDAVSFSQTQERLIAVQPGGQKIYRLDNTEQKDGANMTSYVTRLGIPIGRQTFDGQIKPDIQKYKNVYSIYPRITGTDAGVINVYIGRQNTHGGGLTWSGPYTYTIGTDYKVDVRLSGKLIAIKFESTTNITWTLEGFGLEVQVEGDR